MTFGQRPAEGSAKVVELRLRLLEPRTLGGVVPIAIESLAMPESRPRAVGQRRPFVVLLEFFQRVLPRRLEEMIARDRHHQNRWQSTTALKR